MQEQWQMPAQQCTPVPQLWEYEICLFAHHAWPATLRHHAHVFSLPAPIATLRSWMVVEVLKT
eukprot:4088697-Amphidinium_carterae.1